MKGWRFHYLEKKINHTYDQLMQEFNENRTHQQMQSVHSVHSSSLHLTRLTCLQEVNTSPSPRVPDFVLQHHPNHSDGDSMDPNL